MHESPNPDPPTENRRPPWLTVIAMALVGTVSVAAFALSFTVLRDLAALLGIPGDVAWLWPVIVDGTIAAATVALIAARGRAGRVKALIALALFALVSIAGNVVHILLVQPSQVAPFLSAVFVGAVPPVGLLLTVEMLVDLLPSRERRVGEAAAPAEEAANVTDPAVTALTGSADPVMTNPVESSGYGLTGMTTARGHDEIPSHATDMVEHAVTDPLDHDGEGASVTTASELIVTTSPSRWPPAVTTTPGHEDIARGVTDSPDWDVTTSPITSEATDSHDREDTSEVIEPAVPVKRRHTVESIPTDPAGQVDWIVERARTGHDVTKRHLMTRLKNANQAASESTVQRRIREARKQNPAAFEAGS